MINGDITKDGLAKGKVDLFGVCSLRVMSIFCVYNVVSGSMVDVLE